MCFFLSTALAASYTFSYIVLSFSFVLWSILEHIPCTLEKNKYSAGFWKVLFMSAWSILTIGIVKTTGVLFVCFLLIFCFDALCVIETGVLKSYRQFVSSDQYFLYIFKYSNIGPIYTFNSCIFLLNWLCNHL